MVIGVVSDSHEMSPRMRKRAADALRACGVQRLIHLGDGEGDAQALAQLLGVDCASVAGNCDLHPSRPEELTLRVLGHKLLVVHGHNQRVKLSPLGLLLRARELCCDVALFGHTHCACVDAQDGVLLVNPGALMDGQFCVLTIDEAGVTPVLHKLPS